MEPPRQLLAALFRQALVAVNGEKVVQAFLQQQALPQPLQVLAIGKAASAMMRGAMQELQTVMDNALVITKRGFVDPALPCRCVEAAHPKPDESSLAAGQAMLEFLHNGDSQHHLLVLLSGGTSSLVEVLPAEVSLAQLQHMTATLLANGADIAEINRIRKQHSLIKGGRALEHVKAGAVTQLLISDVQGDDISVIGSAPFVATASTNSPLSVDSHIVASNQHALDAIVAAATAQGYPVHAHGQTLFDDVDAVAARLAAQLQQGEQGVHVWGGEPTVVLPVQPGQGGRCQQLALALALHLQGSEVTVLVGATDGNDGVTSDAGAIVDGQTVQQGGGVARAKAALAAADANCFLAESGDLLSTGATDTNVMDVVIAFKP